MPIAAVGEEVSGTESPAVGRAIPAGVYVCYVIEVDAESYTLTAKQNGNEGKVFSNIPWAVPYCHQAMGEGINFLPEPGATCIVAVPSDAVEGIVIGWVMATESGSYKGGRQDMNPGDMCFSSRDGNFVWVRRGGIVQVGTTPLSQFLFIPIRNLLHGIFENWKMTGVPGELLWEVDRAEGDNQGNRRCSLTLNAKEFANDPKDAPAISLKLGSHQDGGPVILSLKTRSSGGGDVNTTLEIRKDGSISWTVGACTLKTSSLDLSSTGPAKIHASQDLTLSSDTLVALRAPQLVIAASGGAVELGSSPGGASQVKISGDSVLLGEGQFPPIVASTDMYTWMLTVTTAINALAPSSVTMPNQYTSEKVKV